MGVFGVCLCVCACGAFVGGCRDDDGAADGAARAGPDADAAALELGDLAAAAGESAIYCCYAVSFHTLCF